MKSRVPDKVVSRSVMDVVVMSQTMALMCMMLGKSFGWGKKRLTRLLDNSDAMLDVMSKLNKYDAVRGDDIEKYVLDRYGINTTEYAKKLLR